MRNPPSAAVKPQAQLPYHVSPTSKTAQLEAEKKIAALTQQLEDEMDKTPNGEYFGKRLLTCSPLHRTLVQSKTRSGSDESIEYLFLSVERIFFKDLNAVFID